MMTVWDGVSRVLANIDGSFRQVCFHKALLINYFEFFLSDFAASIGNCLVT